MEKIANAISNGLKVRLSILPKINKDGIFITFEDRESTDVEKELFKVAFLDDLLKKLQEGKHNL